MVRFFRPFAWLFEKMTRHSAYQAQRSEVTTRLREVAERTESIKKQAPALEARRRTQMAQALTALPGDLHVKAVLIDLYAIGGKRALEAIEHAIDDHPMGRSYLSVFIDSCVRSNQPKHRDWRSSLRSWSARELGIGYRSILRHSGSMTNIRFMLALEGFATLVGGAVTIDPGFMAIWGAALESARTMIDAEDSE